MITPTVIPLVDENDQIIGYEEKLMVHQKGLLHRAFSILVFNKNKDLLIHQRALEKYHSPGLWTNTCCGHPNQGENMEAAVHRRLQEEMGFDCELQRAFAFQYFASFDNGLIENEIDHVYVGEFEGSFAFNVAEVAATKWMNLAELRADIAQKPENYTVWFKEIMDHPFLQHEFKS
jgi:isopentenyl-diphosphate Delta-isomerase